MFFRMMRSVHALGQRLSSRTVLFRIGLGGAIPGAGSLISTDSKSEPTVKINADFKERIVVHFKDDEWVSSPMAGVERRRLDRVGSEKARATSLVRFAPGSHFSRHTHTGGEEFVVLDGTFTDEHGDFKAGSYVRSPPTSNHAPWSDEGCTIFVKLWQFDPEDRTHVLKKFESLDLQTVGDGVKGIDLHQDDLETVKLLELDDGATFTVNAEHGFELLVLKGVVKQGDDILEARDWLRLPEGTGSANIRAVGGTGTRVWIKEGHLKGDVVSDQIARVCEAGA